MELVNKWFPTKTIRTVNAPFGTYSTYKKELVAELTLSVNALHKAELEYHGKFGHNLGIIKHIALMSRICICYST